MTKKIGILTGGGDCAGLNAVIASIVKSGYRYGYDFIGFKRGWEGVLDMDYIHLDQNSVRGISHLGGTILHTTNHGRFAAKVGFGETKKIEPEILDLATKNLARLKIDVLVAIGGDGTLTGAEQMKQKGTNIVCVPKSIDNDLMSTDQTFGFSTAVQTAVDALDKIHTTATSHDRIFVVECMGRNSGWIALESGLSGGAHAILLPEMKLDIKHLVEFLRNRKRNGKGSSVIMVAEGVKIPRENLQEGKNKETKLEGVSWQIIKKIEQFTDKNEFELRNVILGHLQRGGSPNAYDRILAKRYGTIVIDAIKSNQYGTMVSISGEENKIVQIEDAIRTIKSVDIFSSSYQTARKIGIFL